LIWGPALGGYLADNYGVPNANMFTGTGYSSVAAVATLILFVLDARTKASKDQSTQEMV